MSTLVNDGTGPLYDRPRRIDRHTARRPEPVVPTEPEFPEWDAYQALLAEGWADEDARLAIWPDNALVYREDADGTQTLLPVGKDGLIVLTEDDDETETGSGDASAPQDAPETPDAPQTPAGDEIAPETGAEGSDPQTAAEDAAALAELNRAADAEGEIEPEPTDAGYDPSAHTRDEVVTYLAENPDQRGFVLDRERTGKARVSLIGA